MSSSNPLIVRLYLSRHYSRQLLEGPKLHSLSSLNYKQKLRTNNDRAENQVNTAEAAQMDRYTKSSQPTLNCCFNLMPSYRPAIVFTRINVRVVALSLQVQIAVCIILAENERKIWWFSRWVDFCESKSKINHCCCFELERPFHIYIYIYRSVAFIEALFGKEENYTMRESWQTCYVCARCCCFNPIWLLSP